MDNVELFKKRISSLIERSLNGKVELLPFMDEMESAIINDMTKNIKDISVKGYGGFINSDRLRWIFTPYDFTNDDFEISLYKIKYNEKYNHLTHQSILGSLMGLGIKRECIGDIYIDESNNAYFSSTREISKYLFENFQKIGNAFIEIEEIKSEIEIKIKYEIKTCFISSMRLDAVIASEFNLSRNEANDFISQGLVMLNHLIVLNNSKTVSLYDEISIRHKGRIKILEIGGLSKSGRTAIKIGRRI